MGWFKVDDQLAFHAKVMMAGNSAMGLWVRAGSWSSAQLTNGFIPAHMANAMAADGKTMVSHDLPSFAIDLPSELIASGLWQKVEGGFQFHDWTEFQPDAKEEKSKREDVRKARSAAGKRGAEARWNPAGSDSKQHGKSNGKPMANAFTDDGKPMAPTRPDPTPIEEAKASSPATRPDVQEVIDCLSAALKGNDVKFTVGKSWHTDARRLIDTDKYTVEQIRYVIRFATTDEFWKSNVLSMSKLRAKFEQLKLKAIAQSKESRPAPAQVASQHGWAN